MVIALHAYRPIKQLCSYCRSNRYSFRMIDAETIVMVSGIFSGIVFEFRQDCCRVKVRHLHTCFDLVGDFSADALMHILASHNIIRIGDLDLLD